MASKDYPDFQLGMIDEILDESIDFLEDDYTLEDLGYFDTWVSSMMTKKENERMSRELKESLTAEQKPGGGRFKSLSPKELQDLEQSRQAKSTKKNTQWGIKIFQDWCIAANGEMVDFQMLSAVQLNDLLRQFYAEAAPKHIGKRSQKMGAIGREYHKNTLKNIRGAINRHLTDIGVDFDIVRDKQFKTSNNMLDAKLKCNVGCGLSVPTAHKPIISKQDLKKICSYLNTSQRGPIILRFKVWYDLAIHFVSRGLEFHAQLSPKSFIFQVDDHNKEYVTLTHETKEKTRQGGLDSDEGPADKRMYASNDEVSCPVRALKFFLGKTDPNATSLFNHCSKAALQSPENESIWYSVKPVKMYQFSRFMSDISKQANCSKQYTAHCLRATAIQTLSDAGFELRHIMYMSGHRNESSIRSYSRDCSTQQKEALSNSLSTLHCPNESTQDPTPSAQEHPVSASLAVNPSNVAVSNQISNRNSSNLLSAGIMSHSSFMNCTIQFFGNNNPI